MISVGRGSSTRNWSHSQRSPWLLGVLAVAAAVAAVVVGLGSSAGPVAAQQADTCGVEFGSTGGSQTWPVPPGVDSVTVDAYGAQGGDNRWETGGLGAGALGTVVPVTPGDQFELLVGGAGEATSTPGPGGAGGFNGGGDGGEAHNANYHQGSGGGGASTVTHNGETLVIAAGGGGAAHGGNEPDPGGSGGAGGLNGEDAVPNTVDGNPDGYGRGATTGAGGAGGAGSFDGLPGTAGSAGQGGHGGGATGDPDEHGDAGAGGGGGLYGGGGGGGGGSFTNPGLGATGSGGGGGSSFGQSDTTFQTGVKDGDGLVRLTYQQKGCGVTDLAIAKSVTPAVVDPGGQIAWSLTVTNNGPDNSTGSTVTDPIPDGVTNVTTTTPGCTVADGAVTCTLGALAAGDSTEIDLTGTAPSTGGASMTNTATVDGNQYDPNPNNNTASATTSTPPADVTIAKTVSDSPVSVGQKVTYELVVTNNGPTVATDVTIDDPMPRRLVARGASSTQGDCAVGRNAVGCQIGTLTVGQSVTVTVVAVARRAGRATNTATVSSPSCANSPCDSAPARVRIAKPKLVLSKTASRKRVRAGATVVYTIRVRNPSIVALRRVHTCDRLPAGLVYVSAQPKAALSKGQFCWTIGRLAGGKSRTYRMTVRALPGTGGTEVNRATASSPNARAAKARRAIRVPAGQTRGGGVTG